MKNGKERLMRAVPFVMAMLLITLVPLQNASALFGQGKQLPVSAEGAPIAQNMEIKVYRNVPYTGMLRAVDRESTEVTFAIVDVPKKGTVKLTEDGLGFIYTPNKNKIGIDSFAYTATDENGNVSLPATVKLTIERAQSGVSYADMDTHRAATAAVDLAEHSVFVGAKVGENYFFEPEHTLNRGEFIAMAMAASGEKTEPAEVTGFCDDDEIPAWCKGYAVSALSNGVICGVGTEQGVAFEADAAITLNEAAVVLNRLLAVTDVDPSSYDETSENVWCAQAIANLQSVSILQTGCFTHDDMSRGITRGEAAELLSAAMALRTGGGADKGLLGKLFG